MVRSLDSIVYPLSIQHTAGVPSLGVAGDELRSVSLVELDRIARCEMSLCYGLAAVRDWRERK